MSVTNDFVPFCYQDTGTNLEEQADYLVDPQRTIGNQPGIASSQLVNKALRQGTAVAANLAQYISNQANINTLDNGNEAQLLSQIMGALQPLSPVLTQYLSGTGTWNATFQFFIASGNATAGATYTNNTFTYTVVDTISSGLVLQTTGAGVPSAGGTLTKSSGTGDSTLTFYAFRSAFYLKIRALGAGGGGGGSGLSNSGGSGADGSNTTFGTSLIVCNGGSGGVFNITSPGGSASLGIGPVGLALTGGSGQSDGQAGGSQGNCGGNGASGPLGGAGGGGGFSAGPGADATTNTGAGGGGAGGDNTGNNTGSGGGCGGYVECIIYSPAFSYTYQIGTGGGGGTAGSLGGTGGAGADGLIEVTEYFQ